jgi:hypothetical protein
VPALLFAAAIALLANAIPAQIDGPRGMYGERSLAGRGIALVSHKAARQKQSRARKSARRSARGRGCRHPPRARQQAKHRRGSTHASAERSRRTTRRAPSRIRAPQDRYAILLKSDLTGEQRDAAIATLRNKYNLKITKTNSALDLLYVSPRSSSAAPVQPPKTVGAAVAPKIIQDLRQEPFVDAAYVSPLDTPASVPGQSGKTGKKR